MRFKLKAGSVGAAIGIIGGGVQLAFPDAAWAKSFGVTIIVVGFLAFLLDVEIDNARVRIGQGQRTWRDHLDNVMSRLRRYWSSLALVVFAIGVIAFALERSWFRRTADPPPANEHPAALPNKAPGTPAFTCPSQTSLDTGKKLRVSTPGKSHVVFAPVPQKAERSLKNGGDSLPSKPGAPTQPLSSSMKEAVPALPVQAKPPEPPKPSADEVAAARKHREAGEVLFKRLFDAKRTGDINSIVQEVEVWDRNGADLVVDALGEGARPKYLDMRAQHEFYPPFAVPLAAQVSADGTRAYFLRGDTLNLIRSRQLALSTMFTVAR
jgi:hypothetical protein